MEEGLAFETVAVEISMDRRACCGAMSPSSPRAGGQPALVPIDELIGVELYPNLDNHCLGLRRANAQFSCNDC